MSSQPLPRAVLRKAAPAAGVVGSSSGAQAGEEGGFAGREGIQDGEPYCLLDSTTWQMCPQAVAGPLTAASHDFCVTGVLGAQGLCKSAFLNRLLGFCGDLPAAGPHPTSAFPVWPGTAGRQAQQQRWQHCTRGITLRVSADRQVALDTQPLFSASVLADMVARWEQQPPAALAAPAVAAAGEGKAAAVPYEGVQALAQLQLAVLLLSTCHRVLVFCEGVGDGARCTWDFMLTAEMLARGIPDPSLPPRDPQQPATVAAGAAAAAGAQPARQAPPQEHLAEVVLVHVVAAGSGEPSAAQLQLLDRQLDAFFASSRLRRPGPLRMLEQSGASNGSGHSTSGGSGPGEGMSYWVLPALPGGSSGSAADPAAWATLVAQLLGRPCPPLARRCSGQQWLRGVAGDCWRAVRKSTDIATFYSRLARTQLKGAAGWGLARP